MRPLAVLLVLTVLLTGCGIADQDLTSDVGGPPDRCARVASGGLPAEAEGDRFWELMTAACQVSSDGDRGQGRALRELLSDLPDDEVVAFHEGMVREHRRLARSGVGAVADDLCIPGLGLGNDLSADYRTWLVGQGEAVTAWVRAEPGRLTSLPGAARGCGLGEPLGSAAFDVHRESTRDAGRGFALVPLESLRP